MKIVSLDIGGTSIKSGIWCGDKAEELREFDTNAKLGGAYVVEHTKDIIKGYSDFDAIGISTAGQVNSKGGYIRYANENIPGYTGMRIRELLEEEFHVPVAVENDVNAAAIGEGQFGAGKEFDDFLCITYGTGVGGAIVIQKKIYTGSMFSAGEFGAMLVHGSKAVSGEPFSGCYEKYASTTALVKSAMLYNSDLDNGRKIFSQLENPKILEIVDCWIDEIVNGLGTIIHLFNPACIILGGGVMSQPYIIDKVRKKSYDRVMESFRNVELRTAALGNQAGLLGAAFLAREKLNIS